MSKNRNSKRALAPGGGAVSVRKFPYPYRCALAVSNDIDETTLEHFREFHNFLNTDTETSYGEGLGLEIGSSFWMFDVAYKPGMFCYFEGVSSNTTECAPIIRDLCRSGHLDVLHTYGNFSRTGGFTRALATQAVEEMLRHGIRPQVWINHGDGFNEQNIGLVRRKAGDSPGSEAYHADMLRELGILYLEDSLLTDVVGQDRPCGFAEAYLQCAGSPSLRDAGRKLAKAGMMLADKLSIVLKGGDIFHRFAYSGNNSLLCPSRLQDGQPILNFRRYGLWKRALADEIPFLLSERFLSKLEAVEGHSLIYVHLGRFRTPIKRFSDQVVQAFRSLKEASEAGRVWVTTVSRLLHFNTVQRNLKWSAAQGPGEWITITIGDTLNAWGMPMSLGPSDLQGLSFYTDRPEHTRLVFNAEELPVRVGPKDDAEGSPSISIPLAQLERMSVSYGLKKPN